MAKLTTRPWYSGVAWPFSYVLDKEIPREPSRKFQLNHQKAIDIAFEEKAKEFGISVRKVESFQELQKFQYGFLVYGYFVKEEREGYHMTYVSSGFHIALYHDGELIHQNVSGFLPTYTSMEQLRRNGFKNPIYFAVTKEKQE